MAGDGDRIDEVLEQLSGLYQKDPEEFERLSKALIRDAIEGFPERHRARAHGLQFRIDAELDRYNDATSRLNRMVEMFWEGFNRFQDAVSNPGQVVEEREENRASSKVLPFRRSDDPN
ncbi:MAG: hypothetical protein C0617_12490 [Desulfuromonas sp.]|uniref:DUF3135 domain-containing protein n=1 Tax=Desulfuromonas sp. TaxID=892 RepID=UPI000CBCB6BE|nr:DUF3135 domain-containing protein [Desulfuromonas sp.]PLX83338.1 MAG: hypothetical protein C0617_12490 [Desulfuromonas sp.]